MSLYYDIPFLPPPTPMVAVSTQNLDVLSSHGLPLSGMRKRSVLRFCVYEQQRQWPML